MSTYQRMEDPSDSLKELLKIQNQDNDVTIPETIQFCCKILKINKRNKKQARIFLLTQKAIYNIKVSNKQIPSIQRRIDLFNIASITESVISTEFTLNVPSEYDYRYDTKSETLKNEILSAIAEQEAVYPLIINKIANSTTNQWTVTKDILKSINKKHYDPVIRSIIALSHLENMGFKRNMARNSLYKNKGNISNAIQDLIKTHIDELEQSKNPRSSFISYTNSPIMSKIDPISISADPSPESSSFFGVNSSPFSPSQSFTLEACCACTL